MTVKEYFMGILHHEAVILPILCHFNRNLSFLYRFNAFTLVLLRCCAITLWIDFIIHILRRFDICVIKMIWDICSSSLYRLSSRWCNGWYDGLHTIRSPINFFENDWVVKNVAWFALKSGNSFIREITCL